MLKELLQALPPLFNEFVTAINFNPELPEGRGWEFDEMLF